MGATEVLSGVSAAADCVTRPKERYYRFDLRSVARSLHSFSVPLEGPVVNPGFSYS